MKQISMHVGVSAIVAALSLATYHFLVFQPAQRVAVVDIESIISERQAILAGQLVKAVTDQDRLEIQQRAKAFPPKMERAIAELAAECRCQVLDRTVLVGPRPGTPDLTAQLKQKVSR